MSQDYDKIFKENIEEIILPLIDKLLGIRPERMEEIPNDLQTTIERRPDLLKKVMHEDTARDYILHVEFQLVDQDGMVERMLEYYGILNRRYRLPIQQHVIFIGPNAPEMITELTHPNVSFRYNLVSLSQIDYELFLTSDNPGEVILAILSRYTSAEGPVVIDRIIDRLKQLWQRGVQVAKYLRQLEVLSKIRNLQPQTVRAVDAMALTYDMKTDIRYLQGKQAGEYENKQTIIMRLLKQGVLTHEVIAEIVEVPVVEIREMAKTL